MQGSCLIIVIITFIVVTTDVLTVVFSSNPEDYKLSITSVDTNCFEFYQDLDVREERLFKKIDALWPLILEQVKFAGMFCLPVEKNEQIVNMFLNAVFGAVARVKTFENKTFDTVFTKNTTDIYNICLSSNDDKNKTKTGIVWSLNLQTGKISSTMMCGTIEHKQPGIDFKFLQCSNIVNYIVGLYRLFEKAVFNENWFHNQNRVLVLL